MSQPKYQNKKWLKKQYTEHGRTCKEIAEKVDKDISGSAISHWNQEHNLDAVKLRNEYLANNEGGKHQGREGKN